MVMKPNNVKFSDFWTHDKQKKNMHFNFSWTLNYEKVKKYCLVTDISSRYFSYKILIK